MFIGVTDVGRLKQSGSSFQLIDARSARAYAAAHAAGAVNLDANGLHPVVGGVRRRVEAGELTRKLAAAGIGEGPAVVYGGRGGSDAALAWWTLRGGGLRDAMLLDGGIAAWHAAGLPMADGETATTTGAGQPALEPDAEAEIGVAELKELLTAGGATVVDTRSPEEFSGEDQLAGRGGHIPGAQLVPWNTLMEGDPPLVRPRPALEERLAAALAAPEVVLYCHSGPRAAHTYAVMEMLGHPRPRLYLGSWAEWGNDASLPVETGGVEAIMEERR